MLIGYAFIIIIIITIQKRPNLFCTLHLSLYTCLLLYSLFSYIIGKGKETWRFHGRSSIRPWTWWWSTGNHIIPQYWTI